jgi:hypothetical protein
MSGKPGRLGAAFGHSAREFVEAVRVPGLAVWWTRGSEAAVMAGHAHHGTCGAPFSSGQCYAVTHKVEFRGLGALE